MMKIDFYSQAEEVQAQLGTLGEQWRITPVGRGHVVFDGPEGVRFSLRSWARDTVLATFTMSDTGYGDLRAHSDALLPGVNKFVSMKSSLSGTRMTAQLKPSLDAFRVDVAAAVVNRDRADARAAAIAVRAEFFADCFPGPVEGSGGIRSWKTDRLHAAVNVDGLPREDTQRAGTQFVITVDNDIDAEQVAALVGGFLDRLHVLSARTN